MVISGIFALEAVADGRLCLWAAKIFSRETERSTAETVSKARETVGYQRTFLISGEIGAERQPTIPEFRHFCDNRRELRLK